MLHRNSIAHEVYFAGNPTLNSHFRPDEAEAPESGDHVYEGTKGT